MGRFYRRNTPNYMKASQNDSDSPQELNEQYESNNDVKVPQKLPKDFDETLTTEKSTGHDPNNILVKKTKIKKDNYHFNIHPKGPQVTKSFNIVERNIITDYLSHYRNLSSILNQHPDTKRSSCLTTNNNTRYTTSNQVMNCKYTQESTWINGIELPLLTNECLLKPYLTLPSSFSNHHRRFIHETCQYLGLYHVSVNRVPVNNNVEDSKSNNQPVHPERVVLISIHEHGFDFIPNDSNEILERIEPPISFPVLLCKPWFYKNELEYVQQHTLTFKQNIQQLINEPNKCLRSCMSSELYDEIISFTCPSFLSSSNTVTTTIDSKNITKSHNDAYSQDSTCIVFADKDNTSTNDTDVHSSNIGCTLIDTRDKLQECIHSLTITNKPTEIAFDLEAYNPSKYFQSTCLLQLCTNDGREYVLDVLQPHIWDNVHLLLQPIFHDSNIIKIGHGIDGVDIPCLHRDFGIAVINVFDTLVAAKSLSFLKNHLGLVKLCQYYGLISPDGKDKDGDYHYLKAKYQRCDWRKRPLDHDMVLYGIYDVRFLCTLRKLLMRDLLLAKCLQISKKELDCLNTTERAINVDKNLTSDTNADEVEYQYRYDLLLSVLKKSQMNCLSFWTTKIEPQHKNSTLIHIMRMNMMINNENMIHSHTEHNSQGMAQSINHKQKESSVTYKVWTQSDMTLYENLVQWRDDVAKEIGTSPSMICPLDLLVWIAYKRLTTISELRKIDYFLPDIFLISDNNDTDGCNNFVQRMFQIVLGRNRHDEDTTQSNGKSEKEVGIKDDTLSGAIRLQTMKWMAIVTVITIFCVKYGKRMKKY